MVDEALLHRLRLALCHEPCFDSAGVAYNNGARSVLRLLVNEAPELQGDASSGRRLSLLGIVNAEHSVPEAWQERASEMREKCSKPR